MDLRAHNLEAYELLDSGGERKLERLGEVILDRPCPQAIWRVGNPEAWPRAQARFDRGQGGTGDWTVRDEKMRDRWQVRLESLAFELRLTGFGNIGLFPEHAVHWSWMAERVRDCKSAEILNLFAYTGGASMACARAGATVTHVDSARAVSTWAGVNADLSGIASGAIRLITDDATKFAKRELRRARRYDGIILDPPTFGRGPKGEVWKIERDLQPLLETCCELLSDRPLFVLLTAHSPGVTPSVLRAVMPASLHGAEAGEMLLCGGGPPLPAGAYARWS